MAALHEEGAGQGPPKRPHVPGLIDAGLVPLQTLMHQCWHQVTTCFAHFQCTTTSSAQIVLLQSCGQSMIRNRNSGLSALNLWADICFMDEGAYSPEA